MTTPMHDATTATNAAVNSRARTGRTNGHRRNSERTAECWAGAAGWAGSVRGVVCAVSAITRERTARH
ncbi:hypothetical protein GCM10010211_04670 [Streptomyces albospinus]|uniref:Uncharacterized protein n=1 Tax=Streptomyces albospinus TaxID=285515 RepID=A0ABQ2UM42_9ACTN|nr:hypothetical protein GCM10010211_04670 [Streptomyces albospinus]